MKHLAYRLYGSLFRLFRLFPVKQNKVVFFMLHNTYFKGNLSFVYDKLKAAGIPSG